MAIPNLYNFGSPDSYSLFSSNINRYTDYDKVLNKTLGHNIVNAQDNFWDFHDNFLNNYINGLQNFDIDTYAKESINSIDNWSKAGGHQYYSLDDKSSLYTSNYTKDFQQNFDSTDFGSKFNLAMLGTRGSGNEIFTYSSNLNSDDRLIDGKTNYDKYHGAQTENRVYGLHVDTSQDNFLKWANLMKSKGATGAYVYKDFWIPTKDTDRDPSKQYVNFSDLDLNLNTSLGVPPPGSTKDNQEIKKDSSSIFGSTPKDFKEIEPLKTNKLTNLIPDVIGTSRLLLALRNNEKVHNIYDKSIHPVLKDTYERYSPVTGDFAAVQNAGLLGAETIRRAEQSATSDGSLNIAQQLEAWRQANQLRIQGFNQDNQRIRQTANEALARQEDNMARRSEVANFNRASIQNAIEQRAENDATAQKSNWNSIDQYLQGFEKRIRYNYEKKNQDIEDWNNIIIQQNALNFRSTKYKNIRDKIKLLQYKYPGVPITYWPEYETLKEDIAKLDRYYYDYLYQQQAKSQGIDYPGLYTEQQRNNLSFYDQGGKIVPKFQAGGKSHNYAIYQDISGPYYDLKLQNLLYQNTAKSSSSKSSSSKSSNKEDDFTKKDFIKSLEKAKLLPNDMRYLSAQIQNLISMAKFSGTNISDLSDEYLQIMPLLNNAVINREDNEKMKDKARQEGTLGEDAYFEGGMYVTDRETNKITLVDFKTLKQNPDRYQRVTYGNLVWANENMPDQANSHIYARVVNEAIGLKQVAKLAKSLLYTMGTTKQSVDQYMPNTVPYEKPNELLDLVQAGPKGYYKFTTEMESVDQNKIMDQVNYLLRMMPRNAIGRLMFETENGTGEEVADILLKLVTGGINTTYKRSASPVTSVDKNGNIGSSKGSYSNGEDPKQGFWASVLSGQGDDYTYTILKNKGLQTVEGKIYTSVPKVDKDMSLRDYLMKSGGINVVLDNSSISFGDIKISQKSWNDIVVSSSSNIVVAPLPKNNDGSVNFRILDTYLSIQDRLQKEGLKLNSPEYIKRQSELMNQEGLQFLLRSDGTPNPQLFGKFMIIEGLASSKTMGIDPKDNKTTKSLEDIEANYIIDRGQDEQLANIIRKALSSKKTGNSKKVEDYDLDTGGWWPFNNDTIYEGNIYIPLTNSLIKAQWADDNDIKASTAHDLDEAKQALDKLNNLNDTSFE